MTYDEACRALRLRPGDTASTTPPEAIKAAFRARLKQVHPDYGVPETGGPTVQQLVEAQVLLLHFVSADCPACKGLTFIKALGSVRSCPTCGGTGRVLP